MGASCLAFAVAIAFWPGLISAAVAPRWAVLAVALPLFAWLDPRELRRGTAVSLALLMAAAVGSIAYCADRLIAVDALILLLIFVATVLSGLDLDKLYLGAAAGLAISAALAIPQFLGWSPVGATPPPPAGLFFNRDVLGEAAALVLLWALLSRRWAWAIVMAVPVVLTMSRMGLCTVAVGLFIATPPRYRLSLFLAAGGILAMITCEHGKLESIVHRLELWQWATSDIMLFGHGIGSYTAAHPAWEYAHSDVLQSLYELGTLGATALVGIFVFAWINDPDRKHRALLAGAVFQVAMAFPLHLPLQTLLVGVVASSMARRRDLVRWEQPDGGMVSFPAVRPPLGTR